MNLKVLIADDVKAISTLIEAILSSRKPVEVFFAQDGEEAVQIAKEVVPDLVFLDVIMPKMNGYEVCKVLKKDPVTARTKIVMLTNLCDELDDYKRNAKVTADEYLSKPFTATVRIDKFEKVMAGV